MPVGGEIGERGRFPLTGVHAIKSLQLANQLHLGLRQTHGLVVLGLATERSGQRKMALAYLKLARRLAKQQHYWLRWSETDVEIHRIGGNDVESE